MASTAATVAAGGQYGAVELKRNYQRYWLTALGISTAVLAVLPLPEFPSYLCIASVLHRGNHIPF